MRRSVPGVEVAHHPHCGGVRCPNLEANSTDLSQGVLGFENVRPQYLPQLFVTPLCDEV